MRRRDILQWLRANDIPIEIEDDDHAPPEESRGQSPQHDQQEQVSPEEGSIRDNHHEGEDSGLIREQPSSFAESSDPPPQHDQQLQLVELPPHEQEGSELQDAAPGMGNDAELTDEQGPSSSSSSSRSSSEAPAESEDQCPLHDRVDNYRRASKEDRRQVYMWTYSRAPEMSREDVATIITNAYAAAGVQILHYSVFREHHPTSRPELERQFHFHIIVESDERHRWRAIARVLRSQDRPMHCSAAGSGRSVYWGAFAYCYVPSAKKPREHLDTCYLLSCGHPDILQRLVKDRRPKRVKPLELGNVLRQQDIRSLDAFYSFAKRQADCGDDRWLTVAYGTQAKRLQEQIAAVWAVETAERRLEDLNGSRVASCTVFDPFIKIMVAGSKCM